MPSPGVEHNLIQRAAAQPCLAPRGHRDRVGPDRGNECHRMLGTKY